MSENRYQIVKLLGKSRTGEVYESEDSKLQRSVALRRFIQDGKVIDFTEHTEEFHEAARSLSNFQHPNILKVFDAGIDGEGAYIVSQLLTGEPLQKEVEKGSLEMYAVADLAKQMLDAFSLSHNEEYFHGALTLNSILMTPQARGGYRYIILDMGLSKIAPFFPGEDVLIKMMADQAFLAPELFDGSKADAQADLYMLGQVLYACLAGGHPYEGLSIDEAKEKHLVGLPAIEEYNQNVPVDFTEWLNKLIAVEPKNRFSSAVEALNSIPDVEPAPFTAPIQDSEPEEVNESQEKVIEPNPIKRTTAPVPAKPITAPVPIMAPGTAPVAITAPQGISSVTSAVPVVTTAQVLAHAQDPVHQETTQAVIVSEETQPPKNKPSKVLLISIASAVVVLGVIAFLVLDRSGDEDTDVEEYQKLITHYDGLSGQNDGWQFEVPVKQTLHPRKLGWLIHDDEGRTFPGVIFPLDLHLKRMFERGWKLTYEVIVGRDAHRVGFVISDKVNPGWMGGGNVSCCVVIKYTDGRLFFYSPEDEVYGMKLDKQHSVDFDPNNEKTFTITIEQGASKVSGEYLVKINGEKIYQDVFSKGFKFTGNDEWSDSLFSSAIDRKSKPIWTIRDIKLETL